MPGGQGRRSTYDGSIDAPAEAGDEIEGGWRREEPLAMDIRRAPQARDLWRTGAQSTTLIDVRLAPTSGAKAANAVACAWFGAELLPVRSA